MASTTTTGRKQPSLSSALQNEIASKFFEDKIAGRMKLTKRRDVPEKHTRLTKEKIEENLNEVSQLIQESDIVLLLAGAGWSADSGLPIYNDVGKHNVYKNLNFTYADLSTPRMLTFNPNLFFGFWGDCFNMYRNTEPHEGYAIFKNLCKKYFEDSFICTSNVDNHFMKLGFEIEKLDEIHGDAEHWQCSIPCNNNTWTLSEEFRFKIDQNIMECKNHIRCESCEEFARPNVLMFGDSKYVTRPNLVQSWIDQLDSNKKVLILEIGCGRNVSTLRQKAKKLVEKRGVENTHHVRINPDTNRALEGVQNNVCYLPMKGLEFLKKINEILLVAESGEN